MGQLPFLQLLRAWALTGLQQAQGCVAPSGASSARPCSPGCSRPSGRKVLAVRSLFGQLQGPQRATYNAGTAWARLQA